MIVEMNNSKVGLDDEVEEISHTVEQNDEDKNTEKMRLYKCWSLGDAKSE